MGKTKARMNWRTAIRGVTAVRVTGGAFVLLALYLTSLYSFLLFHGIAELFSTAVAFGIFMVGWNSRRFVRSGSLLFLGIGYLFVGGMDAIHMLAYKGMDVFAGYDADLATQLWIASRYMESLALLTAPFLVKRKLNPPLTILGFVIVTLIFLSSIFYWRVFPACFIEGTGLTPFKIASEYIICLLLFASIGVLWWNRQSFDRSVYRLMTASIAVTICSELAFTLYISAYGLSNLTGHLLKVVSFYLLYIALVEVSLKRPFESLFRDLTRTQKQLRKSEEQYRKIFSHAAECIVLIDVETGLIVDANNRVHKCLGFPPGELLRIKIADLAATASPGEAAEQFRKIAEHGSGTFETRLRTKTGGIRDVLVDARTIRLHGKLCVTGILRDITAQKKLEKEKTATDELRSETRKMDAVRQLAGGIAHDFNNILQAILGYTDVVKLGLSPVEQSYHDLEKVQLAAERAATLTRQLLAFSRRQIIQPTDIDLLNLVAGLKEKLKRIIGDHIDLDFIHTGKIGKIHADPWMIEQMLAALCSNARDATPDGGRITIGAANVQLNDAYCQSNPLAEPGCYIDLSVTDTGDGMTSDVLSHALEPFFSTKEVGKGTGLGLSMVYGIVTQHKGLMDIHSEPGKGTAVHLYLPVIEDGVPDAGDDAGKKDMSSSGYAAMNGGS